MELLVVIAIISVLSVVAYIAIQGSQDKAKNDRVRDDLLAIGNALEQYKQDHNGAYPIPKTTDEDPNSTMNVLCYFADATYAHDCATASFRQGMIDNDLLSKSYLSEVPTDPHTNSRYVYGVSNDGKYYEVAGLYYDSSATDPWTARSVDNLGKGFELPSLIRAYDGPNFVTDKGVYLPFSPDALLLTATLQNVEGPVYIKKGGADPAILVSPGTPLTTVGQDDVIIAKAGATPGVDPVGKVDLYFSDGSLSHIEGDATLTTPDGDTEITVSQAAVADNSSNNIITKIRLFLKSGKVWSKVARLASKSEFNIETSTAIAGVRGTEFGFNAGADGSGRKITVFSGQMWSREKTDQERAFVAGDTAPDFATDAQVAQDPSLAAEAFPAKTVITAGTTDGPDDMILTGAPDAPLKADVGLTGPGTTTVLGDPAQPPAAQTADSKLLAWFNKVPLTNNLVPYLLAVTGDPNATPTPTVTVSIDNENHFVRLAPVPFNARVITPAPASMVAFRPNADGVLAPFACGNLPNDSAAGLSTVTNADSMTSYSWVLPADAPREPLPGVIFAFQNETCAPSASVADNCSGSPHHLCSNYSRPPIILNPLNSLTEADLNAMLLAGPAALPGIDQVRGSCGNGVFDTGVELCDFSVTTPPLPWNTTQPCSISDANGYVLGTGTQTLTCSASCTLDPTGPCQNVTCAATLNLRGNDCSLCVDGFGDCVASTLGCETILNTINNCGQCGHQCVFSNAAGTCAGLSPACAMTCNTGYADCNSNVADGCEIRTTNDTNNCGSCGTVCNGNNGTPVCTGSQCFIACNTNFANCNSSVSDGCEADLRSNLTCGTCSNSCQNDTGCIYAGGGTYSCNPVAPVLTDADVSIAGADGDNGYYRKGNKIVVIWDNPGVIGDTKILASGGVMADMSQFAGSGYASVAMSNSNTSCGTTSGPTRYVGCAPVQDNLDSTSVKVTVTVKNTNLTNNVTTISDSTIAKVDTKPALPTFSPVNVSNIDAYTNNQLQLTFNEAVYPGNNSTANLNLWQMSGLSLPVAKITVSIVNLIAQSGATTLTIPVPLGHLLPGTSYMVTIDPGAIKDQAGNVFPAALDPITTIPTSLTLSSPWKFGTAAAGPSAAEIACWGSDGLFTFGSSDKGYWDGSSCWVKSVTAGTNCTTVCSNLVIQGGQSFACANNALWNDCGVDGKGTCMTAAEVGNASGGINTQDCRICKALNNINTDNPTNCAFADDTTFAPYIAGTSCKYRGTMTVPIDSATLCSATSGSGSRICKCTAP